MHVQLGRTNMGPRRLDLARIECSLEAVQRDFAAINRTLDAQRDPITDEVRENMMAGYCRVDAFLEEGVDLFELGNSGHLLELNTLVLCGTDVAKRKLYAQHISATEKRFYEKPGGGIGPLMEWLQKHRGDDVWHRAAGVYTQIISRPELYIEGNHRTGVLIASYLLAREGQPPFVLSGTNAKAYFAPSSLVKATRRDGIGMLVRLPRLRRRLAQLLKDTADAAYLIPV